MAKKSYLEPTEKIIIKFNISSEYTEKNFCVTNYGKILYFELLKTNEMEDVYFSDFKFYISRNYFYIICYYISELFGYVDFRIKEESNECVYLECSDDELLKRKCDDIIRFIEALKESEKY